MSWFQRRKSKPDGMYNASSHEYACANCAYFTRPNCNLHHMKPKLPDKRKCGDFLRADCAVPDPHEVTQ